MVAAVNTANTAGVQQAQSVSEGQQRTGNDSSGSSFCKKVVNISKFMFQATGATALVAIAATNPTITSALSSAFSKVAAVFDQGGAFVSANLASFATGSIAAGAFNVIDGVTTIAVNASKSRALTKLNDSQSAPNETRAKAFSNLKKMYASAQRRGAIQVAIGAAATAVGVLALVGVLSNPFGLAAAGGVASLVLAGVQIHKFVQNRRIKAEMARFNDTLLSPAVSESIQSPASGVSRSIQAPANSRTRSDDRLRPLTVSQVSRFEPDSPSRGGSLNSNAGVSRAGQDRQVLETIFSDSHRVATQSDDDDGASQISFSPQPVDQSLSPLGSDNSSFVGSVAGSGDLTFAPPSSIR